MSSSWVHPVQITFRGASFANNDPHFEKRTFVINPRSNKYRFWETVSTFCTFLTCLIVPFQASLNSKETVFWVFAYIFDALFLLDMLLRFRVGYYSKGTLVNNTSLIRRSYLRGQFVLDLLTILPLDFLAFGVKTHLHSHQTLALLRLNRTLRVLRLVSFFGKFAFIS